MRIEFDLDDELAKWLRHYQLNPIERTRASEHMKNLQLSEFAKALVVGYTVQRLKDDNRI